MERRNASRLSSAQGARRCALGAALKRPAHRNRENALSPQSSRTERPPARGARGGCRRSAADRPSIAAVGGALSADSHQRRPRGGRQRGAGYGQLGARRPRVSPTLFWHFLRRRFHEIASDAEGLIPSAGGSIAYSPRRGRPRFDGATPGRHRRCAKPPAKKRAKRFRVGLANIAASPVGTSGVIVAEPRRVEDLPGYAEGWFSVQDAGAQLAAPLLDAHDGMRVLDACAAPGGKTTHLAELAELELVALDDVEARLERVAGNLSRLR